MIRVDTNSGHGSGKPISKWVKSIHNRFISKIDFFNPNVNFTDRRIH